MTFLLSDLSDSVIGVIGFGFYLICLLLLVCAVRAFGHPNTGKYIAFCLVAFVPSFLLSGAISIYCARGYLAITTMPPFTAHILALPVWFLLLLEVLSFAAAALLLFRLERTVRAELSAQSVCEGLDQLPDGVCVSLESGYPRLVNNQMQHISNVAFGTGVTDTLRLDRRLEARELSPGCGVDEQGGNRFLLLPDESVWQLRRQTIRVENRGMTETIAYDVTKRYHDLLELQQRNERLAAVNRQLRDSLDHMDRIVREKEILSAKIKLHSNLGQGLLAVETYLTGGETSRKTVIHQLTQTVALLHGDSTAAEEQTNGRLDALFEAAKAVGVEIKIDGDIPENHRQLIEIAIHECLTNTVKHAAGHRLDVAIRCDGETTTVVLTNDGAPPAGPIRETGGLANLRKLTEKKGGVLEIESAPVFCATLRLKEEDI